MRQQSQPDLFDSLSSLWFVWRYLLIQLQYVFSYVFTCLFGCSWLKPSVLVTSSPQLACCSKAPSAVWLSASVIVPNTQAFEARLSEEQQYITALEHHLRGMWWGNKMVWNRNHVDLWTLTVYSHRLHGLQHYTDDITL